MENKTSKLKTSNIIFSLFVISLLFIFNIIGINRHIYSVFDLLYNPYIIQTRKFSNNIKYTFTEFQNIDEVFNENFELKRQITENQGLKAENSELKKRIETLELQLDIESPIENQLTQVEVVTPSSVNSRNASFLIRSGEKDGIRIGQQVLYSTNTLIGLVTSTNDYSATVTPFFAENFGIGDRKINVAVYNLESTQDRGFVREINNREIRIRNIPKDAVVDSGDIWVTTEDIPELSPNLIIGQTNQIYNEDIDDFQEVSIDLTYNLSNIKYVFVENVE